MVLTLMRLAIYVVFFHFLLISTAAIDNLVCCCYLFAVTAACFPLCVLIFLYQYLFSNTRVRLNQTRKLEDDRDKGSFLQLKHNHHRVTVVWSHYTLWLEENSALNGIWNLNRGNKQTAAHSRIGESAYDVDADAHRIFSWGSCYGKIKISSIALNVDSRRSQNTING